MTLRFAHFGIRKVSTIFCTGEGIASSTRHPGEEPQAAGDRGDEEEEGGEETAGGRREANRDVGGSGAGEGQADQPAVHLLSATRRAGRANNAKLGEHGKFELKRSTEAGDKS